MQADRKHKIQIHAHFHINTTRYICEPQVAYKSDPFVLLSYFPGEAQFISILPMFLLLVQHVPAGTAQRLNNKTDG